MLLMYLSCPATTSLPAILRGKLSKLLHSKKKVVVVVVVVVGTGKQLIPDVSFSYRFKVFYYCFEVTTGIL